MSKHKIKHSLSDLTSEHSFHGVRLSVGLEVVNRLEKKVVNILSTLQVNPLNDEILPQTPLGLD